MENLPEITDDSIMPFGNYKGSKMIDVPAGYLLWLIENTPRDKKDIFSNVFEYLIECKQALEMEIKAK